MKPIQILMDAELLAAVEEEAQKTRSNRSKLIREALEKYLAEARRRRLEDQDQRAYERRPQRTEELAAWERIQTWPED